MGKRDIAKCPWSSINFFLSALQLFIVKPDRRALGLKENLNCEAAEVPDLRASQVPLSTLTAVPWWLSQPLGPRQECPMGVPHTQATPNLNWWQWTQKLPQCLQTKPCSGCHKRVEKSSYEDNREKEMKELKMEGEREGKKRKGQEGVCTCAHSLPSSSAAGFQLVLPLAASVFPAACPWMLHKSAASFWSDP